MKYPWANVALLVLLVVLVVTGYFGFTNGEIEQEWLLWLHGIAAYGLMVLLFWKASIIFDAWRRKKTWTRVRVMFVVDAGTADIDAGVGVIVDVCGADLCGWI